jgi:hypothetical protein
MVRSSSPLVSTSILAPRQIFPAGPRKPALRGPSPQQCWSLGALTDILLDKEAGVFWALNRVSWRIRQGPFETQFAPTETELA